jgi:transcriptional regulator with GAF, ATPase, and Fis domain
MNKQQQEEQDTFFDLFDEWSESLPVPEVPKEYCLDNDVEDFIIDKVKDALMQENWNQTKASKRLGIKRTTLIAKCKKLKIFNF